MATKAQIVQQLMAEFSKTSSSARGRTETIVGEITVDLLNQNESRFDALSKSYSINLVAGTTKYKLPTDFKTAKTTFYETDSDSNYKAKCLCLSKSEVFRRIDEGAYTGYRLAYIERDVDGPNGRGDYLVFADDPDETKYIYFEYYRHPTEDDTDIIRNTHILKTGCRGGLPDLVPGGPDRSSYYSAIYERMKMSFRDVSTKRTTARIMTPNIRTGQHNKKLYDLGHMK